VMIFRKIKFISRACNDTVAVGETQFFSWNKIRANFYCITDKYIFSCHLSWWPEWIICWWQRSSLQAEAIRNKFNFSSIRVASFSSLWHHSRWTFSISAFYSVLKLICKGWNFCGWRNQGKGTV
jgi:hypothetical protein